MVWPWWAWWLLYLGVSALIIAWLAWMCHRAPYDTDLWPGGDQPWET